MIKSKLKNCYYLLALLGVIVGLGCAQAPQRKKMPGYLNAEEFEYAYPFRSKADRMNALSFTAENEDFLFEGSVQRFVSVPFPDASYDGIIADMVDQYLPLAPLLLSNWIKEGNKGIIVDFGGIIQGNHSATYRIEKAGEFSFPMIFRWDAQNAYRANLYMGMLKNVPGIQVNLISK